MSPPWPGGPVSGSWLHQTHLVSILEQRCQVLSGPEAGSLCSRSSPCDSEPAAEARTPGPGPTGSPAGQPQWGKPQARAARYEAHCYCKLLFCLLSWALHYILIMVLEQAKCRMLPPGWEVWGEGSFTSQQNRCAGIPKESALGEEGALTQ